MGLPQKGSRVAKMQTYSTMFWEDFEVKDAKPLLKAFFNMLTDTLWLKSQIFYISAKIIVTDSFFNLHDI